MARLKVTTKVVDPEPSLEEQQLSDNEEDISQVDADLSELMGSRDKPPPTLRFGRSLVTRSLVDSYVQKGYFGPGVCRASKGEEIPDPREDECVVFRDFFIAVCIFRLIRLCPRFLSVLD